MAQDITIYTTNTCAYCVMVKKYLQLKGHSYQEVNIEEIPEKRAEMMQLSGQMAVPVTVVTKGDGSRDVTIGYNVGKLASALA